MTAAKGLTARICLAFGLCIAAGPAMVQEQAALSGTSAVLRGLDKVNGRTVDLDVPVGTTTEILGLMVSVSECRYPADNPTGDAYAYLTVRSPENAQPYFEGWMIASSPALNALDHNRYDVWVIRCNNS